MRPVSWWLAATLVLVALAIGLRGVDGSRVAAAPLDTDGDGIPNSIESMATYQGKGGSPRHKDIWVECDYMKGLRPAAGMAAYVRAAFDAAPLKNPDGEAGVRLHVSIDDQIPFVNQWGDTTTSTGYEETYDRVMAARAAHFDGDPRYVHYCVFANRISHDSSSGISLDSTSLLGGIPGDTFIVSLGGAWADEGGRTAEFQAGTFMHELGHNLGLTHGGYGHANYKPNYISVMNYDFQFGFLGSDGSGGVKRLKRWDYSRFRGNDLNEDALDEMRGVRAPADIAQRYLGVYRCEGDPQPFVFDLNRAVDWNCDGVAAGTSVVADINADRRTTTLVSQNNWANLRWTGGAIAGARGAEPSEQSRFELTVDQWLDAAGLGRADSPGSRGEARSACACGDCTGAGAEGCATQ